MVYTINQSNSDSSENCKGSVWKELVFAFVASIPFFTQGIESTTLTSTAHAGHFTSQNHVPWSTTTYILAAMASAPIFCYVIERFGRKVGIFIISLVQGISCIPLLLDISEINILVLHTLAGITTGGLFTVFPTYIREISSTSTRGLALSLMMPMTAGGYMMNLVMGLEELTFLMVALVAVQMMMVFCLLESPSYLVMIKKYECAKFSIAHLKCLPPEHPTVLDNVTKLKEESDRARAKGNLHLVTILKNPIWRDATKIGLVLQSTMILGGSIVFLDQNKALEQLKLTEDPDRLLALTCFFAGSLVCTAVIRVMERRYLLSAAYFLMVISMGVLAVYTQADLTVTSLRWVPVAALGVLVFGYGVAWGLPTIVIVELFNFEVRAHQLGLLFVYCQLIKLAHVHSFPYIEAYVGVYTLFYIFAGVNLFGAVYCLFHIPDLENKTTRQIERQLKRVPLLKM
ncbi:facilitated trehalose transporter Tret1-like [Choristoneura fumiferana]|uniref:facilitated trehalose transporter Tret1-like n=1 Tax=Choristoneura fumiferana TaxID=7141 RepID=UPI003D15E41C